MMSNKMNAALIALAMGLPLAASAAESPQQWYADGEAALQAALALKPNTRQAKNVILFVGDGMGISTVTATRIYDGQSRGESGEENRLAWERLPYVALSKTYNTNLQTPDSAGTMSAMMTGIKTDYGVISVDQRVTKGDCASSRHAARPTLLEQAEAAGMATGIVTTARITHATPAATYAHTPDRDWENDSDLPKAAKAQGCVDIARQLIEFAHGDGPEVMLGGGRRNFLPRGLADPEHADKTGERTDGRNLIAEWQRQPQRTFVWNGAQLAQLDPATARTHKLLGLFSPSHMAYEADRLQEIHAEPSLADMTQVALSRLQQFPEGYFLMVEGGRIDHAHHAGNAARALADGQALNAAVAKALSMVNLEDTLVVVTADHSHVFTMAGYPARGNPILGLVHAPGPDDQPMPEPLRAQDNKPYTTLGYLNGPGYAANSTLAAREQQAPNSGRHLTAKVAVTHKDFFQESLVPLESETHGGEDVAIYAGGPWAHLFHQTHEQNYIYHVMRHALGLPARARPAESKSAGGSAGAR